MKSPKAKQGVLLALFILTALSFVSCTATKQPNTAATTDVQLTAAAETSATPTTAIQITTQVATQEPSTTASMETTEAEMPTESPTYESYVGTWSNTDDPMMGGMGIQFRAFDGNIAYFKISSHTRNASRTASVMEEIVAEVHDNQINYEYQDSFLNYGEGTILLQGDTIHLNAEITASGNGGYGIAGNTDMHQINDSIGEGY